MFHITARQQCWQFAWKSEKGKLISHWQWSLIMCPKGAEWFSETVVFSSFNWLKHSGFSRAFAWSLQDGEEGAEWMRYLSENRSLRVPAASECPGQRMQQLQFLSGQPRGVPANQPDSVNCHQFNTFFLQRKIKQIIWNTNWPSILKQPKFQN